MAGTTQFGVALVEANDVQNGSILGSKLSAGAIKQTIIAGGAAGAHTVTGIATADRLISVLHLDFTDATEVGADISGEFTISGANTIDNAGGTVTTGGFLMVTYIDNDG